MLLSKALCPHVHSLDPGVSGYVIRGTQASVCLNSFQRRDGSRAPGEGGEGEMACE